jgi:hypothetical protein
MFSGGIDSLAVLAACLAWKIPCVCAVAGFTGGTEPPADISAAKAACETLGVKLIVREVGSVAEVAAALARLAPVLCHLDVEKAKTALSTYFAAEALKNAHCGCVFGGGGAESLLAGVDGDVDGARASARDETSLELSSLRCLFHAQLQRDHAAAYHHDMEIHHPFLSAFVAKFALDVPGRMKRLSSAPSPPTAAALNRKAKPLPLPKRLLRVALERHPFDVPRSLTRREPLKPDVGGRFGDAVVRVALRMGFRDAFRSPKSLAEATAGCAYASAREIERKHVEEQKPEVCFDADREKQIRKRRAKRALANTDGGVDSVKHPPPPSPSVALLYTSGRNSAAAFHKCETSMRLKCASIVPFSDPTAARLENFKNGQRHGGDSEDLSPHENQLDPDHVYTRNLRAAAARFADAVGIPLWNRGVPGYTARTRFKKNETQTLLALTESFVRLRADYGILGVVHGHAFDVSALCAVEEAAERAGLISLAPVWRDARSSQDLLNSFDGAAGFLVTAGSSSAVGRVVRDARVLDALITQSGGPFAADADTAGTVFDAIPSEAAFFDDAAVAYVGRSVREASAREMGSGRRIDAAAEDAPGWRLGDFGGGVGYREIEWDDVSVVRRPRPPQLVRDVGGRGWSAA